MNSVYLPLNFVYFEWVFFFLTFGCTTATGLTVFWFDSHSQQWHSVYIWLFLRDLYCKSKWPFLNVWLFTFLLCRIFIHVAVVLVVSKTHIKIDFKLISKWGTKITFSCLTFTFRRDQYIDWPCWHLYDS